jgi:hypothetical protein
MKHEIKQGDSLWLDVTGEVADIDSVWANWSGKWSIVSTIGGASLAGDNLIKTATTGKFRLQVPTLVSAGLTVGEYYLCVQVENTVADYRKEIAQDRLKVTAQGITP